MLLADEGRLRCILTVRLSLQTAFAPLKVNCACLTDWRGTRQVRGTIIVLFAILSVQTYID